MITLAAAEWVPMASLIASCIGLPTVVGLIVTDLYKRRKDKLEENSTLVRKQKEEELQQSIRSVIKDEVKPLIVAVNELQFDSDLTKQSIQATLRHELYEIADKWKAKGYCPTQVKEDFENMYQKYHSLGKNGVMDTIRDEIMTLPTSTKTKGKCKTKSISK